MTGLIMDLLGVTLSPNFEFRICTEKCEHGLYPMGYLDHIHSGSMKLEASFITSSWILWCLLICCI